MSHRTASNTLYAPGRACSSIPQASEQRCSTLRKCDWKRTLQMEVVSTIAPADARATLIRNTRGAHGDVVRLAVALALIFVSTHHASAQFCGNPDPPIIEILGYGIPPLESRGAANCVIPELVAGPFFRLVPSTCNPAVTGCQVDLVLQFDYDDTGPGDDDPFVMWLENPTIPANCDPGRLGNCPNIRGLCHDGFDGVHNETVVELAGVTCSNTDTFTHIYSAGTWSCPSGSDLDKKVLVEGIPLGGEALAVGIGCISPPIPQWDTSDCPLSPLGGTSGLGSMGGHGASPGINLGGVGGGGINLQGSGIAMTPPDSGPRIKLRYFAGGAGHPGFPATTTEWTTELGRYWSHDAAQRIVIDPNDPLKAWLLTGEGNFRSFRDTDQDAFEFEEATPSTEFRELTWLGTGWELRYLDGVKSFFDENGRWTGNEDPNQNAVVPTYDVNGRLEKVAFPDGIVEVFTYDANGRLQSIEQLQLGEQPGPRVWTYSWSGDDLTSIERPDGTRWLFTYGASLPGYITLMRLESNDETADRIERGWAYDAIGHVRATWRGAEALGGAGETERWDFDYSSLVDPTTVTVTDPGSDVTTYTLEWAAESAPLARVTQIVGACPGCGFSGTTTFGYTTHPLLPTTITDNGDVTSFTYNDANGRVATKNEAGVRNTTWVYEDTPYEGLVQSITQPSTASGDRKTTFGYDAFGNLTSRTIQGMEAGSSFTYTTAFFPSSAGPPQTIDPPRPGTGDQTTFTYDSSRGSLLVETRTDPLVLTTTFTYDEYNRTQEVTDPDGTRRFTMYDEMGRVKEVRECGLTCFDSDDLVTQHGYDKFGDLFRTILPGGNLIDYSYDVVGRVKTIHRRPDASTNGERTVFTYDAAGNVTTESRERWSGTWVQDAVTTTEYESRCHVGKTIRGVGGAQSVTEFQYDCKGRLSHVWDANHPQGASPDPNAATRYEYDALDRLVKVIQPRGTTGQTIVTEYQYDVQDHLERVIDGEGNETIYTYSDRDLLTQEQSPVAEQSPAPLVKTFFYDEHGNLDQEVDEEGSTRNEGTMTSTG